MLGRRRLRALTSICALAGSVAASGPAAPASAPRSEATLAATGDAASVARARRALALLGARDHLEEWPELALPIRDRARAALGPELMALLQERVRAHLSPDTLLEALARRFSAGERAAVLAAAAPFGRSPTGRAARSGAERALSAEGLARQPLFLADRMLGRPGDPRLALVGRLAEATALPEHALDLGSAVATGFAAGLHAFRCHPPERWPAASRRADAIARRLARQVSGRVQVSLLFQLDELEIETLVALVRAAETTPLREFHATFDRALEEVLADQLRSLRAELAQAAEARCGR